MKNSLKYFSKYFIKSYPIIPIISLLFIVIFSIYVLFTSSQKKGCIHHEFDVALSESEKHFASVMEYTQYLMKVMSHHISNDYDNNNKIYDILKKYTVDINFSQNIPITFFSWVDINDNIIVDSYYGVLKDPINLSRRGYLKYTKNNFNDLFLGDIVKGSTSNVYMIPAGIGVELDQKYVGSIVIGFKIDSLLSKISNILSNKDMESFIIDQNLDIIKSNLVNISQIDLNDLKNSLEFMQKNNVKELSDISIFSLKSSFKIRKIANSNYFILVKFNDTYKISAIFSDYIFKLIELLFIVIFTLILLIFIFKNERKKRFKLVNLNRFVKKSEINRAKFLNSTSHDLRNHIYGIKGITELLASDKKIISNNELKELVDLLLIQSIAMTSYVEDILDDNQAKKGKMMLTKINEFNPDHIIKKVVKLCGDMADKKDIMINCQLSNDILLNTDQRRFEQVILNLLSNSIKYSNNNTEINISSKYNKRNNFIEIAIQDNGCGMSQQEIDNILSDNISKDKKVKKKNSYGIGFENVMHLLDLLKGQIDIKSKIKQGSIITLKFII